MCAVLLNFRVVKISQKLKKHNKLKATNADCIEHHPVFILHRFFNGFCRFFAIHIWLLATFKHLIKLQINEKWCSRFTLFAHFASDLYFIESGNPDSCYFISLEKLKFTLEMAEEKCNKKVWTHFMRFLLIFVDFSQFSVMIKKISWKMEQRNPEISNNKRRIKI